ncbi:hypothetical protein AWC38_SpisGene16925 [Stylophora pistillata]|uniref:EGF-like domain-containing protein n=1 Tax=Stylophora pistillata TaxID=50429 RepID=A0A2B4RPH7_STYPI|nr:hypothetical protein AWC38_SpisGene16925 [Stylophora pistillata]
MDAYDTQSFCLEQNPCGSSPCFNNGTCQAGYTDRGFRCKCPPGFTGVYSCSFDFEDGIGKWEKTGRAFIYQPTFGDNPVARKRESAQLQGYWWVGGAEKRPKDSDPAGWQHPDGADVVRKETGNCSETMYPKSWDVEEFIGQYAQVRFVDEKSCCWSHINFDNLKGDIICPHDLDEKN